MKKTLLLFALLLQFFISGNLFSQNEVWSALGSGLAPIGSGASAMTFYQGDLYVARSFTHAGNVIAKNIAKWDGSSWSPVGAGTNGIVYSMVVYNNELYAAGQFSLAGGNPSNKIAKWNGTNWSAVGQGLTGTAAYSMEVYKGKLFVGGKFSMAGNVAVNNIACWNDTTWSAVGNGILSSSSNPEVDALLSFNGKLFAGGIFDIAGSDSSSFDIANWDGNIWSHVGEGFYYGQVSCLSSFGGSLVAGGNFWVTAGFHVMNNISRWDGTNWNALGVGTNSHVFSLCSYANNLYVGGWFSTAGGNPNSHIAAWDGTTFSSLGTGTDNAIYSIIADEGIVYAAGMMDSAGAIPANKIAKWSDAGVGVNEISENHVATIFPNPSNGFFRVVLKNNSQNSEIEIYNSLGEKISDMELKEESTEINLSNEAKGIYFYRIFSEENLSSEGKIMKE